MAEKTPDQGESVEESGGGSVILEVLRACGLSVQEALGQQLITPEEAQSAHMAEAENIRCEKKAAKRRKTEDQERRRQDRLHREEEERKRRRRELQLERERAERAAEKRATEEVVEQLTDGLMIECTKKFTDSDLGKDVIAGFEQRLLCDEQRERNGQITIEDQYALRIHLNNARINSRNRRAEEAAQQTVQSAKESISRWCRAHRSTAPSQYGWSEIDLGFRITKKLQEAMKKLEPLEDDVYRKIPVGDEPVGPGGEFMRAGLGD